MDFTYKVRLRNTKWLWFYSFVMETLFECVIITFMIIISHFQGFHILDIEKISTSGSIWCH